MIHKLPWGVTAPEARWWCDRHLLIDLTQVGEKDAARLRRRVRDKLRGKDCAAPGGGFYPDSVFDLPWLCDANRPLWFRGGRTVAVVEPTKPETVELEVAMFPDDTLIAFKRVYVEALHRLFPNAAWYGDSPARAARLRDRHTHTQLAVVMPTTLTAQQIKELTMEVKRG